MAENRHLELVQVFVRQLYDSGVRDVCISPGSRSTPLTMAFVRHGGFSIWSILDERSSGFFAVGIARAKMQPVALVCTSGTAVGNYLPAVMEAHSARLPLLLLTGDRPPELYDSGANQTTRQHGIYAPFIKWEHQMPVPEFTEVLQRHARSVAVRAVSVSSHDPAGPVHINWPFREPLILPSNQQGEVPVSDQRGQQDSELGTREIRLWRSMPSLSEEQVTQLHQDFHQRERGLIVCGPTSDEESAAAIVDLAAVLGWPVLADPLSHIRTGNHRKENVMNTADLLLRSSDFQVNINPEIILRFGAAPTSKVLLQYLQRHASVKQVVVDANPIWRDPVFTATDIVQVNPMTFCKQLVGLSFGLEKTSSLWLEQWQALNENVTELLKQQAAKQFWYEGQVVPELTRVLPQRTNVFVGNSMPIRDFDSFQELTSKSLRLFANRGVSGIDGVVSSALGVAAADRSEPTVLVIGDVSLYHDLNALLASKRNELDLLVVVVNNDGGGIFSFLAQAQYEDTFHHFRTPHGVDFSGTAQLYEAKYSTASDWEEFRLVMERFIRESGLRIVEMAFDTYENTAKHQELVDRVIESVEALL